MKRHRRLLSELPPGFSLRAEGGHFTVVDAQGEPLRSPEGLPIQVSYSPSDWRTQRNELARIRRALAA